MRGFQLDKNGDVIIDGGAIQFVEGAELLRQTVEAVLGTNKGEWMFNAEEGISYRDIFTKNPDKNIIREELLDALRQCDESFVIEDFACFINESRHLVLTFSARRGSGEVITGGYEYA